MVLLLTWKQPPSLAGLIDRLNRDVIVEHIIPNLNNMY